MLSFDELPDSLTVTDSYYLDTNNNVSQDPHTKIVLKDTIISLNHRARVYVSILYEVLLEGRVIYLAADSNANVCIFNEFPKQWTLILLRADDHFIF